MLTRKYSRRVLTNTQSPCVTNDMQRWHTRHSIDNLQNHTSSHPALLEKVMMVMMGEKNNERREMKVQTPF